MPALNGFEEKMELMSTEYEQAKEIIVRYDEVIAQKASKESLLEIKEHLETFLIKHDFENY